MMTLRRAGTWLFGFLLVLHGIAHSPGILGAWQLRTFEDVSGQPNILLQDASDRTVYLLGFVWLIGAVAFVVTGVGVIRRAAWWPTIAILAIPTSLVVSILWWEAAMAGLVINLGLIVVLSAVYLWNIRKPGQRRSRGIPRPA